jgi:acyl-CoA synthetase (AMP-forming)/AMP-acid ligase II
VLLAGASISANSAALAAAARSEGGVGVGVIALTAIGSVTGLFRMALLHPLADISLRHKPPAPPSEGAGGGGEHPQTVLLLHTSGTSGNKKLVPYSLDMLVVGVGCIVSSWCLSPSDVCLNMMPLFHIGGIVRNILSPLLAGGAVITCAGFDPLLFWDILYQQPNLVTWSLTISLYSLKFILY